MLLVFARRGAARGQLPDLQHLLDHGRPADPRVRPAAHARGPRGQMLGRQVLEAALLGVLGAGLGLAGGHRLRHGHERALQELRDRPAEHRHGDPETRTIMVALLIGIGRDARRRAGAGAAGHARHADGRAAGGRAARGAARRGRIFTAFGAARDPRSGSCSPAPACSATIDERGQRRRADRAAGRWPRCSASRCSARGWCARSPRSAGGRSSGCAASPGGSPARTRCASRAAPR